MSLDDGRSVARRQLKLNRGSLHFGFDCVLCLLQLTGGFPERFGRASHPDHFPRWEKPVNHFARLLNVRHLPVPKCDLHIFEDVNLLGGDVVDVLGLSFNSRHFIDGLAPGNRSRRRSRRG
jgi:hypothetical protein